MVQLGGTFKNPTGNRMLNNKPVKIVIHVVVAFGGWVFS
jgi:hypothetical protein